MMRSNIYGAWNAIVGAWEAVTAWGEATSPRPPPLPTCVPSLDQALNGGLVPGRLVSLEGPTGVGKTTLALHLLAQRPAADPTVWLDADHTWHAPRARAMGIASSTWVARCDTDLDAVAMAVGIVERLPRAWVVLDALLPSLDRGATLRSALTDLARKVARSAAVVIVIDATADGGQPAATGTHGSGYRTRYVAATRLLLQSCTPGGMRLMVLKHPTRRSTSRCQAPRVYVPLGHAVSGCGTRGARSFAPHANNWPDT